MASGDQCHAALVYAAASDSSAPARSAVEASWVRAIKEYGLDPERFDAPGRVDTISFRAACEELALLLNVAQSTLDRLFIAVGGAGCSVLLTNPEGILLERRSVPADEDMFRSLGITPGACWREAEQGTNGMGTVIAERRAMTIHRGQHFFTRYTSFSCTGVPIYDHEGAFAGVLDVSSCRADFGEGLVPLIAAAVEEAARRIETTVFRQVFIRSRILTGHVNPNALLAVDRHDVVVGATRSARRLFGLSQARLADGVLASALLEPEEEQAEDLLSAERGAIQRALLRAGGNVSATARRLGISRATLHRKMTRPGREVHA